MSLEPRAQTLLKTLVERYIAEGQPVGSRVLSKLSRLELSPATIRNIMADLEEMGFVASPHTSAGRIPTPKGFRVFVDTLLTVQPISESSIKSSLQLSTQVGQPQKIISNAAQMLSSLTQFAGVVLAPQHESAFTQIEFLRLSEKTYPAGHRHSRRERTEPATANGIRLHTDTVERSGQLHQPSLQRPEL